MNPETGTSQTEEQPIITKDMTIMEAIQQKPEIAPILMSAGMHCISCPASLGETIEEAAMVHGFDVDDIMEAIHEAV